MVYRLGPGQDRDIMETFTVATVGGTGVLRLEKEVDYERKALYQVVVEAMDRASVGEVNTAVATILVEVQERDKQFTCYKVTCCRDGDICTFCCSIPVPLSALSGVSSCLDSEELQLCVVQVEDIEDRPPEWVDVASVTRISEDVPLFSPVGSAIPYNYVRLFCI